MSSNLQNSIWPNPDGILGYNKVQIPDGVTTFWPEGDALVGNFVYNKGKLVGLVDTKALIANESKSTTFPYDYVNIQLDKSLEDVMTFNGGAKPEYLKVTYSESTNDYNPNGLPIGYKQLEYLESTGTQYINTLESTYRLTLDFHATSFDNGGRIVYFGLYDDVDKQTIARTYQLKRTPAAWGVQVGQTAITSPFEYGVPFRITIDEDGNVSRDGEVIGVVPLPQINDENASPHILAQNTYYSYGARAEYHVRARVFSVILGRDGKTTRNFVPCLDPTGAPCMFDLVSRKPFYNSGTGDFLYPNDVEVIQTTNLDDKFYAQLTEHGVRRLYHVPEGCNMSKDEYAATNGFKEIVEPPMPLEGYWMPIWRETETQLILDWVETEPPVEETNI